MDEQQLAAIRAASAPTGGSEGSGGGDGQEEGKRATEEQMRRDLLATVLDSAARERLARIALVSPARSRQIEGILLQMAQTGQLRGRVSEEQLIGLLERAEASQGSGTAKKGAILYQRRHADPEDDFDFDI